MTSPITRSTKIDEDSPAFGLLADLIARDELVVITGAGVSFGLKRKDATDGIPGWTELLIRLHNALRSHLPHELDQQLSLVLSSNTVSTQCLLEAASALRDSAPEEYERALLAQVTPEPGQYSQTHIAIEELMARGVITFNYDDCHEAAHEQCYGNQLKALTPYAEDEIAQLLAGRMRDYFLLKAHGCVHSTQGPLVLDWSSYRTLLAKQPAYRAFFQHVLTNFSCLFVGFGLADPDFDTFVDVIAATYGSPISQHVAIRHLSHVSPNEFVLSRRYGIQCLHVSDFAKIPDLIRRAASTAGPFLQRLLEATLSTDITDRQEAHRGLHKLGTIGRRSASAALIERLASEHDEFRISEIAYSLGTIDAKSNKRVLMNLVANPTHNTASPAARALTVLRPVLTMADIPVIEEWRDHYATRQLPDDIEKRLLRYCEYYLTYLPSKFNS